MALRRVMVGVIVTGLCGFAPVLDSTLRVTERGRQRSGEIVTEPLSALTIGLMDLPYLTFINTMDIL